MESVGNFNQKLTASKPQAADPAASFDPHSALSSGIWVTIAKHPVIVKVYRVLAV
jgi:hypothetical protein